jgi:hypothetical protein
MNIILWAAGLAVVTVASGDAYVEAREAVHCDQLAGCSQQGDQHQRPIVTVQASALLTGTLSSVHVAMSGALSGSPMPPFYFPDTTIEREYEIVRPARAAPTVTLYMAPTPPAQNRYDAR